MASEKTIAALDIGSSKMCCFVAVAGPGNILRVTGSSHHISRGIKNGTIIDMEAAYDAIAAAVQRAEQMAGVTLTNVVVSLAGARPESHLAMRELQIGGGAVREADINRLLHDARINGQMRDHELIHAIPVGFAVDDTTSIKDPLGMYGDKLRVNMHFVNVKQSVIRNIAHCVNRCHLGVKEVISGAYAAGLACLTEEERDLGSMVIDFGGGTTSFAVFYEGALIHTDSIPVGGIHVTNDIARGLSTPVEEAEKLKCRHGSALPSSDDDREILEVPTLGDPGDVPNTIPKSYLVSIIAPRIEETIELVRDQLEKSGVAGYAGPQVAITGGASQLPGVRELTQRILNKQARNARPIGLMGLAEATSGPAFSSAAGLLSYAIDNRGDAKRVEKGRSASSGNLAKRVGNWLRETFF
ncbi:MAG: cell division protein FtsA [Alphaproteobacteria bacterium]|nr:cell division protein FtsA [Alphaproteobacteria bacterium]